MTLFELLGDELAGQVQAKIDAYNAGQPDKSKQAKFVDLSEGGYVGREKYDRVSEQVKDLQNQINQRNTDMADLKTQLETAAADGTKLSEAQKTISQLQSQYEEEKQNWETKLNEQAYEFRIRELTSGIQFSSNSAKNEFVRGALGKKFAMEGDQVLGFDDYLKTYKESDPGAFKSEAPKNDPVPTLVLPGSGQAPAGPTMTLAEAMKRKNAGEKVDISSLIKNNRKE